MSLQDDGPLCVLTVWYTQLVEPENTVLVLWSRIMPQVSISLFRKKSFNKNFGWSFATTKHPSIWRVQKNGSGKKESWTKCKTLEWTLSSGETWTCLNVQLEPWSQVWIQYRCSLGLAMTDFGHGEPFTLQTSSTETNAYFLNQEFGVEQKPGAFWIGLRNRGRGRLMSYERLLVSHRWQTL